MSAPFIVTIAGMSGTLAKLITKHLLSLPDTNIHINGLIRKTSKLPESTTSHSRVTLFECSADNVSVIRSALQGASVAIFCQLGDKDFMVSAQKTLIDACIAENVPRYIAGDWSFDFRKLNLGDHPNKDPMKHIQEYLEQKEAEGKIKAVHVLIGCFLEIPWRQSWNAGSRTLTYWGTGEERWELTSYDNVAEFTAKIAVDVEASGWFSCKPLTVYVLE